MRTACGVCVQVSLWSTLILGGTQRHSYLRTHLPKRRRLKTLQALNLARLQGIVQPERTQPNQERTHDVQRHRQLGESREVLHIANQPLCQRDAEQPDSSSLRWLRSRGHAQHQDHCHQQAQKEDHQVGVQPGNDARIKVKSYRGLRITRVRPAARNQRPQKENACGEQDDEPPYGPRDALQAAGSHRRLLLSVRMLRAQNR